MYQGAVACWSCLCARQLATDATSTSGRQLLQHMLPAFNTAAYSTGAHTFDPTPAKNGQIHEIGHDQHPPPAGSCCVVLTQQQVPCALSRSAECTSSTAVVLTQQQVTPRAVSSAKCGSSSAIVLTQQQVASRALSSAECSTSSSCATPHTSTAPKADCTPYSSFVQQPQPCRGMQYSPALSQHAQTQVPCNERLVVCSITPSWLVPSAVRLADVYSSSVRGCHNIRFDATQDETNELFDKWVSKEGSKKEESGRRILTTRREALALYRQILRYSNLFVWRDQRNRLWRDVIRESARNEFEVARLERDPELINRMIITGRDAVAKTMQKFMSKRDTIIQEEAKKFEPE